MSLLNTLIALAIVLVAGVVRGLTGFGGALVMTAPLSLLMGPKYAVLTAAMLEASAAVSMLPAARRHVNWRTIGPLCFSACLTVPLGTSMLATLDPMLMRRAICAVVVVFTGLMFAGIRFRGRPRGIASASVGALSGVFMGATSMGGPPVVLYLLARDDERVVTRANLIVFVTAVSMVSVGMLWSKGVLDVPHGLLAGAGAPFFLGGIWVGGRLFEKVNDRLFRTVVLILLMGTSLVILIAG